VALVARSLADPAARLGAGMTRVVMIAAVLLIAAPAAALDVELQPYREAQRAGSLGVVAGRVAAESRTPSGPVAPLAGTAVTLLPRSEALLARLQQLKERSRESSKAFTAAAPAMRESREAYERELWEAGASDLTLATVADAEGRFRVEDVPAGAWLLIAWHGVAVELSGARAKAAERKMYRTRPRMLGFQSVTIWLWPVTVARGATAALELTDRNGWFRGVVEERAPDTGR
jgi:hypothetical protein